MEHWNCGKTSHLFMPLRNMKLYVSSKSLEKYLKKTLSWALKAHPLFAVIYTIANKAGYKKKTYSKCGDRSFFRWSSVLCVSKCKRVSYFPLCNLWNTTVRQMEINLFYCFESNIYTSVISAVISIDGSSKGRMIFTWTRRGKTQKTWLISRLRIIPLSET